MTGDRTALGDRMKAYERATRTGLPRRTYTLIRVDGRSFHSYLRGAEKPYDQQFMADMDAVAVALCKEISGSVFAYVQSDEISVLATDFATPSTQPWFDGEVQKVVSISAAAATAALNARRPGQLAMFDSRAFTIADPIEVGNYYIWRQRDAVRNSIAMAAQACFSHKRLHGVNTGQMQERPVHRSERRPARPVRRDVEDRRAGRLLRQQPVHPGGCPSDGRASGSRGGPYREQRVPDQGRCVMTRKYAEARAILTEAGARL